MKFLIYFFLLATSFAFFASGKDALDWWQTTVLYQVYPRSFKDSDGNGVGDLKGITQKLDHLKDAGIGALWLSPIFTSPGVDFGYDISNYTQIDPLFGTIEDLRELKSAAEKLGLKLLLDLVPNHVSNESEWFKKSVQKIDPYTDYFVWVDPKKDENGTRQPPNNWLSDFGGSAWEWREERQQYYLHQFAVQQADLNYRNKHVVQEIKDVMRYWLDQGMDGFRVDAVTFLFEDEQLRDEPLSGDPGAEPTDQSYLKHVYTQNQPATFDMVQQWRALLDEYSSKDHSTRVMFTEAYADLDNTFKYYGTKERPGAHFTFNFFVIEYIKNTSTADDYENITSLWLKNIPAGDWPNWVVGNHDQHRVASRVGPGLVDAMNALALLMPGTAVTYNGEEIGMEDTFISWNQTVDPQGLNAGPQRYQLFSRDPERTPFQWDNTTSAGFSTSNTTWLPVNSNYKWLNLQKQQEDEDSHYKVYKQLVQLRKTKTIQRGTTHTAAVTQQVFAFVRALDGEVTYIVAMNVGNSSATVDLTRSFSGLPATATVVVASVGSTLVRGTNQTTSALTLAAKGFVALEGRT
ncbi:maltase 2-like [Bacillus rossius redtenbacheri]|uniref:maltase 2-like n=1 Tax=Bacillus rossius redtenbacheri TaxID=93214 RepID=UPI002FDCCFE8